MIDHAGRYTHPMAGGSTDRLRRAARAMGLVLLASLACGLLVPVYTDEVGWRMQLSRLWQDGADTAMSQTCGANTIARPPFFMLPVRLLGSTATRFLSDPLAVRTGGVLLAMAGVALLRGVIHSATPEPRRRALLELYAYALLGIGVLPFLLVWTRPEQPMLLALLAAMLVMLAVRPQAEREPAGAIAALFVIAVVAMSYHPKALFYMPVFGIAIWTAGRGAGRRRLRLAALGALIVMTYVATGYWGARFACPLDPVIAAKQNHENAVRLLAEAGWGERLRMLPGLLLLTLPLRYIRVVLPSAAPMSNWLPPATLPHGLLTVWRVAGWGCWLVASAILVAALVLAVRDRERRTGRLGPALALAGCASGWAALQLTRNAYESALYLPVMLLAAMVALAALKAEPRWLARAAWGIAGVSLASQLLLLALYGPWLWRRDQEPVLADQPYSVSPLGYPRAAILAAGARCGIRPGPGTRHLLVDDQTYFAFADTVRPVHRLGILSGWNGSLGDPVAWLKANGSPGAVLGCRYLPPGLRARAIASGAFCCLSTR